MPIDRPMSATLGDVLRWLEQVDKDYAWAEDQMRLLDKATQDELHSLELDDLDRPARARLATRLRDIRSQRRANKDLLEASEPIVSFVRSDRGRQLRAMLQEVLGKTRKAEEYHRRRQYVRRTDPAEIGELLR